MVLPQGAPSSLRGVAGKSLATHFAARHSCDLLRKNQPKITMPRVELRDRLVMITGAASGIGRALSLEFLRKGCKVIALDKSLDGLQDLKKEASLLGLKMETRHADVSDRGKFLPALEDCFFQYGPPYIFVNNAGTAQVGDFLNLGLEDFETIMKVNFSGVLYGTCFALSKMKEKREGVVVNMASMAGHVPAPYMAAYTASKHAVVGLTRALRLELEMSHSPVKVCLVCPGFVDTPIMKQGENEFPSFLRWMVGSPRAVAGKIVRAVQEGKPEIYPDAGGRLIKIFYRLSPFLTRQSSRLLLAKSWSQLLGKTPIRPK